MRLSFTSEQRDLQGEFERVFFAEATPERARIAAEGADGWDRILWAELSALGWLGVAVDEAQGGVGQGPLALCLVAESFGRRLAAIPFAGAILGFADAIGAIGDMQLMADLLPGVVAGEVIGALVPPTAWGAPLSIHAHRATGHLPALPDGRATNRLLTLLGSGEDAMLAIIDVTEAQSIPVDSLDRINPATALRIEEAPVRTVATGPQAAALWDVLLDRHAVLLAFVQIGVAQTALETACEHVRQRFAFGRPLGSFQAVKHGLSDVLAAIELARSNAWLAAASLEEGSNLTAAAAAARVSASDAARLAARALVHYLGGLGATAESDAHLLYRKAQAFGAVLGPSAFWRERFLADALARSGQAAPLDHAA
ncbi:acyl-CoA dehydrogenase family protein [Sphingomonas sp. CJ20]